MSLKTISALSHAVVYPGVPRGRKADFRIPTHCGNNEATSSEILTFCVRVGPVVVVSATGVFVAIALAIVGRKLDLPCTSADQLLAELAGHGQAVLDAEFPPKSFEKMPAEAVALPALDLPNDKVCRVTIGTGARWAKKYR